MKLFQFASLAVVAALLGGCAFASSPTMGFLYMDVRGPVAVGNGTDTTKVGRACAENYLGIYATGDASIEAAKKAGGITTVASVDHESTNMFLVYATYCTIVKGN